MRKVAPGVVRISSTRFCDVELIVLGLPFAIGKSELPGLAPAPCFVKDLPDAVNPARSAAEAAFDNSSIEKVLGCVDCLILLVVIFTATLCSTLEVKAALEEPRESTVSVTFAQKLENQDFGKFDWSENLYIHRCAFVELLQQNCLRHLEVGNPQQCPLQQGGQYHLLQCFLQGCLRQSLLLCIRHAYGGLLEGEGFQRHLRPPIPSLAAFLADHRGKEPVVEVLEMVKAGANVNDPARNDHRSLQLALTKNYLEVAKQLIEAGADLNYTEIIFTRTGTHSDLFYTSI